MTLHRHEGAGQKGQALVEFALVLPILMVFVMGIFEVALMFNAFVGVNRASQHAAHLAATLGPTACADFLILQQIEEDVAPPNDRNEIRSVAIGRATLNGERFIQQQTWGKGGSTTCTMADGSTITVPYTLDVNGYPDRVRCPVLSGCPEVRDPDNSTIVLRPETRTVDNIGVNVVYRHSWATPLNAVYDFFGGGDAGWTFGQRNIFRMEPSL